MTKAREGLYPKNTDGPPRRETMSIYPKKVSLSLTLEVEVPTLESESYIFESPLGAGDSPLQIGLIADLFDVLQYHTDLSVTKINGSTFAEIQKKLSATL